MENNNLKNNNTGKNVLITFLIIVILGLCGFIVYDKISKQDESKLTEINKVEEKTEITEEEKTKELYASFSKQMKEYMSKNYDEYTYPSSYKENMGLEYDVKLDKNGSLTIHYHNEKESINIATNVLSFYIIETGQGGGNTLFFINEDGTVGSADIEFGYLNSKQLNIKNNIKNYKYIVSIVGATFGDGYSGKADALFIDINGNVYE